MNSRQKHKLAHRRQKDWDCFISHASEDKPFVRELTEALTRKGVQVWFDERVLSVGDSIRRSIDLGLSHSKYGIVVLSHNFFKKEWPQKELDGLVTRENKGERVILPIWFNITAEQIKKYSPSLADKLAVSSERGLDYIVEKLIHAMRHPDDAEFGKSSGRTIIDSTTVLTAKTDNDMDLDVNHQNDNSSLSIPSSDEKLTELHNQPISAGHVQPRTFFETRIGSIIKGFVVLILLVIIIGVTFYILASLGVELKSGERIVPR